MGVPGRDFLDGVHEDVRDLTGCPVVEAASSVAPDTRNGPREWWSGAQTWRLTFVHVPY